MYEGIIIFGPMGAGKDELASVLRELLTNSYIYKLGGDIRKRIDLLANYIPEIAADKRNYYQREGQNERQNIHKDVWNIITYDKIVYDKELMPYMQIIPVIADGRQLNEFEFWSNKKYLTIGIYAHEAVRIERLKKRDRYVPAPELLTHETELQAMYIASNKTTLSFNNDGDLDRLRQFAISVTEAINF